MISKVIFGLIYVVVALQDVMYSISVILHQISRFTNSRLSGGILHECVSIYGCDLDHMLPCEKMQLVVIMELAAQHLDHMWLKYCFPYKVK